MSKENNCYCAFCRTPRRVNRRKHISVGSMFWSALLSITVSFLFWASLDIRALIFFVGIIGVIEFFVQIRWRLNIVCQHCGFDPALYAKSPAAACDRVQKHLGNMANTAMGTMRKLDLPKRSLSSREVDRKISQLSAGKNLSKQV